ncbi:hypothetical protein [Enterococcus gallinarum]|uniref:hypothetical protein n=1 Tax=Enterococcus gallinarum TaxID=1353 RepID=UPI00214B1D72|nr:hypothetical protein [Enterococcus gallinarum]MCR1931643.1 hypothetical protein [Enterococcus gallinarum]
MKKIGFCLLPLIVLSIGLAGCNSKNSSTVSSLEKTIASLKTENSKLKSGQGIQKNQTSSSTVQSSNEEASKTLGMNEEAIVKDDQGKNIYSLKIIKATTSITPDSVATHDEHNNLIEIVYEYKNYNYPNAMSVSTQFLSAYDTNGLAGKDIGYMDGQTKVSSGGKASQSTMWFEMNSDPNNMNEIEIDYSNDFSLGFNDTFSFKVPVSH